MSDQRGPMDHLNIIEQRATSATEGPWDVYSNSSGYCYVTGGRFDSIADEMSETNAQFIVHARDDVPKLVAALKAVLAIWPEADPCDCCVHVDCEVVRTISQAWHDPRPSSS